MAANTRELCRLGTGSIIFQIVYDDVTNVISQATVINNGSHAARLMLIFNSLSLVSQTFPPGATTSKTFVAPTFKVALNGQGELDLPVNVALMMDG